MPKAGIALAIACLLHFEVDGCWVPAHPTLEPALPTLEKKETGFKIGYGKQWCTNFQFSDLQTTFLVCAGSRMISAISDHQSQNQYTVPPIVYIEGVAIDQPLK